MVEPTKAPPDERGGNGYVQPTATASHSDSTQSFRGRHRTGTVAIGGRASLLMKMAKVTRTLGLKSDAASMLREAERIRIALYGSESPQVARVREVIEESQNDER